MFSGPLEKNSNPSLHNPWTKNTVFQHVKNIFLLSQKKLIFFTELNLHMYLIYIAVRRVQLKSRRLLQLPEAIIAIVE